MPLSQHSFLFAEATPWDSALDPKATAIILWVGFGILTIALAIIARTTWGQAKPLSKCIVLSVFAHILLMGFAYTSQLLSDQPALPAEKTMTMTLLTTLDAPPSQVNDGQPPKPWEEFVTEGSISPESVVAAPMDVDASFQPQRSALTTSPAVTGALPQESVDIAEPDRPVADVPETSDLRVTASGVAATEIESPDRSRATSVEDDSAMPTQTAQLQRRDTTTPIVPKKAEIPSEIPSQLIDTPSSLQSITDIEPFDSEGALAAAPVDQLDQTSNQTNADQGGTNASLPSTSEPEMFVSNAKPLVDQMDPMMTSRATGNGMDQLPMLPNKVKPVPRRRLGDGELMPESYRMRVTDERLRFAQTHGGNARTEAAVESALRWLVANQSEDGRWNASMFGAGVESTHVLDQDRDKAGAQADTGITGLALLALLGAGHTHLEGEYRTTVQHGLEFLLRQQKSSGSMAGDARFYAQMYCHSMATLALCEAYAMSGDHRIRPFVVRAVGHTVSSQDPNTGGWRYQPGQKGDMSQFGWQVMVLRSAELAGIEVRMKTRAGMLRFIRDTESRRRPGLYSYRQGEDVSRTMTAEALTCRAFLKMPRDQHSEVTALNFIAAELPSEKVDLYYWYYGTLAMYHVGGQHWATWNQALQTRLMALQIGDGEAAGSWDPDTVWGGYGGRVYTTALATLCLEVYYRYLPIYQER